MDFTTPKRVEGLITACGFVTFNDVFNCKRFDDIVEGLITACGFVTLKTELFGFGDIVEGLITACGFVTCYCSCYAF